MVRDWKFAACNTTAKLHHTSQKRSFSFNKRHQSQNADHVSKSRSFINEAAKKNSAVNFNAADNVSTSKILYIQENSRKKELFNNLQRASSGDVSHIPTEDSLGKKQRNKAQLKSSLRNGTLFYEI